MSTPIAPRPPLTPRQRYLQERQQRQNTTFVALGIALVAALLIALLVFTGLIPIPFGNSFSKRITYAQTGDNPCPTPSSSAVAPAQITVQVINTTQHQGIAGRATDMLVSAGFHTNEPRNSDVEYNGRVRISANAQSVDEAYSVARFFPNSQVILSEASDNTVTVELGTFYDDAMAAEDVQRVLRSTDPIATPQNCLPMSGSQEQ